MNAQMSLEEVNDAVRAVLTDRMREVHQMELSAEEKIKCLATEFSNHSLVEGEFNTERQIFVGIPAMSFVGTINGTKMTISVC